MGNGTVILCRLLLVSLDLFLNPSVGEFVHLDAEVDEDEETDGADSGVDGAAKGEGIVDTMGHYGNQQNAGTNLGGPVDKMVE